jgi:hypothetical protein
MRKWLRLRAFWRQWAEEIVPACVGWAVVAAISSFTSHHFDTRYWERRSSHR